MTFTMRPFILMLYFLFALDVLSRTRRILLACCHLLQNGSGAYAIGAAAAAAAGALWASRPSELGLFLSRNQ